MAVRFADIFYLRPNTITVKDGAGRDVDPYQLSNYSLDSSNNIVRDSYDIKRSVNANLRRDLNVRGLPVSLKVGAEIKSNERDLRAPTETFTFVGQDRINSFATGAPAPPPTRVSAATHRTVSRRRTPSPQRARTSRPPSQFWVHAATATSTSSSATPPPRDRKSVV